MLVEIIKSLQKEEIRQFKYYLFRMIDEENRKDLILFDYIRKTGDEYNEEYIFRQLYGNEKERNNFARLKNRLLNDILKFVVIRQYNHTNENEVNNLITVAEYFYDKRLLHISHKFLLKAEKLALQMSVFEILDNVYTKMLTFSNDILAISAIDVVKKRKDNFNNILKIREIDDALVEIKHRIRTTQNFESEINSTTLYLEKLISEYNTTGTNIDVPVVKIKLYEAVSKILLQKHDYPNLEKYLKQVYPEFMAKGIFNKETHQIKLQVLTYLANSLFKNKKYNESLSYAELLKEAMLEYDKLLYARYLFFYYNILVINYSEIDPEKAIEILEAAKEDKSVTQSSFYNFVFLNLAMLYFHTAKYKNSIKYILLLYQNSNFMESSLNFKLRVAMFELIVRFEQKEYETIEYRLGQIKNDFSEVLNNEDNRRVKSMLTILKRMIAKADYKTDKQLLTIAGKFIKEKTSFVQTDSELLVYEEWLKKKLEK